MLEKVLGEDGPLSSSEMIKAVSAALGEMSLDNKKGLDLGCGFGSLSMHLAKRFKITLIGVDPTAYWIVCAKELAEKAKHTFQGTVSYEIHPYDLTRYPDQSFDVIICSRSLFLLSTEMQNSHLREINRCLKPQGILIKTDLVASLGTVSEVAKKTLGITTLHTFEENRKQLSVAQFQDIQFSDNSENYVKHLGAVFNYFSADLPNFVEKYPYLISLLQNKETIEAIFFAKRA